MDDKIMFLEVLGNPEWIAGLLAGIAAVVTAWRVSVRKKDPDATAKTLASTPYASPENRADLRTAVAMENIADTLEKMERNLDLAIRLREAGKK